MAIVKPRQTNSPLVRDAIVSFTTAGSSAPTVHRKDGVASVSRTGTGEFTLVLEDAAKDWHITLGVEFTTLAQGVFVKSRNLATKTLVLQVAGAGGATAADTTGLRVNVNIAQIWTD